MNVAFRKAVTVDDYLASAVGEDGAPRTELINGKVVFTSPEPIVHARIKKRIVFALERAIKNAGIEAEVFMDGVSIPIDTHAAYEPDASVRLGAPLPRRVTHHTRAADGTIEAQTFTSRILRLDSPDTTIEISELFG